MPLKMSSGKLGYIGRYGGLTVPAHLWARSFRLASLFFAGSPFPSRGRSFSAPVAWGLLWGCFFGGDTLNQANEPLARMPPTRTIPTHTKLVICVWHPFTFWRPQLTLPQTPRRPG